MDQQVIALFVTVALASAVEMVEAATIVLALGASRGWRSAIVGSLFAIVTLALIVLIAGPSILLVPIDVLRLLVGVLLLIFGMQWLRKAILRATGFKALHDEEKIFEAELQSAKTAEKTKTFSNLDKYSFTLSFKTVLLEGFEVIFIVLTFGALKNSLGIATMAAFVSLALVAGAAFAIRKPLTKVPENTLKFVVGTMATTFGIFWTTEGLKITWAYADATLLLLAALVLTASFGCILWLRGKKPASKKQTKASTAPKSKLFLAVRSSLDFVYELLIGDEWITGVSLWLLVALASAVSISSDAWYLVPLYFVVILPVGLRRQVSFQNQ
jgi:uncharacterized membrane protein